MPVSRWDPRCALIVVDLQQGLIDYPFIHPLADVVGRTRTLLDAFREVRQTVVLVNTNDSPPGRSEVSHSNTSRPAGWADLLPELDVQPADRQVTKRTWGALVSTGLGNELAAAGITQVVVTGVATSMGVESTAREAHTLGFNVVLAVDAMTDVDADAHANSMTRVFPRLGERATVDELVAALRGAQR